MGDNYYVLTPISYYFFEGVKILVSMESKSF